MEKKTGSKPFRSCTGLTVRRGMRSPLHNVIPHEFAHRGNCTQCAKLGVVWPSLRDSISHPLGVKNGKLRGAMRRNTLRPMAHRKYKGGIAAVSLRVRWELAQEPQTFSTIRSPAATGDGPALCSFTDVDETLS